jgi:oxygen-independent coproporphyrinogen-3 oxidase
MGVLTSAARVWLTRSFRPFVFTDQYDRRLEYWDSRRLGLYVHIPFCRSICGFCPYCKTLYSRELAGRYIDALLGEVDFVGSMSDGEKVPVTSLYFGGGTPALAADDIGKIISRLQKHFVIHEGIGMELHPQDVNAETLAKLKRAGVTKISIGVQSFQNEYLAVLGRQAMDFSTMFDALSKVRFETVSMDFIFALPGQTIEFLKKDIETAFSNGANHVAVYPFVDFSFTNRGFARMKEKEKKALLYEMVRYCDEQGYVRESIWTFSKNGISNYSSMTRENFLGFGCSATTLLKDQFKINTFDVHEYIKRAEARELTTALTLKFSLRQRMVYYLFWAAYAIHVREEDFYGFFGYPLKKFYGLELLAARLIGWIRKESDSYAMTAKGSYYYHYFEGFYTLSYIDQMWNLMREKAFPEKLVIR